MKIGIIYIHKNLLNGKVYVGKTTQKPSRRFRKTNIIHYKNCSAFYNALKSYGWDNFCTEVIACSLLIENLNEIEEYFINYYNSIAPNGYNLVRVDKGLNSYSDETKKKISDSRKKYYKNLKEKPKAWNKKEHIIDNIPHKKCTKCKEIKILNLFGSYSKQWDKKNIYCLDCHKTYRRKYK